MTDQVNVSQPTPEQQQLIRNAFFNTVHAKYIEFIKSIQNIPIPQQCFQQAYVELDTGILWVKEAIFNGHIINPEPPAPAAPLKKVAKKKSRKK